MAGKGKVTVIDIARAAGVSKSTVSLVLQGSPLVSEATRIKVNSVIRSLGYVYNRGAANLRQSRSRIIGIVVNDLTNSFFAEMAVGMDNIVESAGYIQFLAHTGENLDRQRAVISTMHEHGIAGLIVSPAHGTDPDDFQPLVDAGIPVVFAARYVSGPHLSSLVSDNAAGLAMVVRHLAGMGHRDIAFVGGRPDISIFTERLGGFRRGMDEAGLAVRDQWVFPALPSRAGGREAVGALLASAQRPTAIAAFNDAVAFGVCDGLRAAGLEPGRDVAVTGFDNVIEAASTVPALTTISVDPHGMGQKAAQLLLRQIGSAPAPEHIVTPVRLVVRASCGAGQANTRIQEISA
ncbi:LacI family DNA-binding transcriptional regulator [Pelagibacterium montanilacus]|uniref:LacI family DNA-binding transcriptional regulator n=1 Tax=Pelagibacterium montanilacus TaxID=2185280 RepID=UPI000F8CFCF2|nr:LacI family DNA-binding transcriptional regulator [Pelagibacterium montanilacus]